MELARDLSGGGFGLDLSDEQNEADPDDRGKGDVGDSKRLSLSSSANTQSMVSSPMSPHLTA